MLLLHFHGGDVRFRPIADISFSPLRRLGNGRRADALFYLEGPDEDGSVWITSTDDRPFHFNLGPADKVAEVLSQWLASLDDAERDYRATQDE